MTSKDRKFNRPATYNSIRRVSKCLARRSYYIKKQITARIVKIPGHTVCSYYSIGKEQAVTLVTHYSSDEPIVCSGFRQQDSICYIIKTAKKRKRHKLRFNNVRSKTKFYIGRHCNKPDYNILEL